MPSEIFEGALEMIPDDPPEGWAVLSASLVFLSEPLTTDNHGNRHCHGNGAIRILDT